MLRFTLTQLVYFSKVSEYGSIAETSRMLNISSPSVSFAISNLEKDIGVKLFVRHHAQGLVLTENGKLLLRKARKILKEANQFSIIATELSEKTGGSISIGCTSALAKMVCPNLRKEFEKDHPNIKVRQFELDSNQIIENLRHLKIDIALTYDVFVPTDLKFIPLLDLPPYVVMSESHELANKQRVLIEELKQYPMILLDIPHYSDYVLSIFKQKSLSPIIVERTKNSSVNRSLVGNGFGYSITNFKPLTDQSPDGKPLKFIPIDNNETTLSAGFMTLNDEISSKQLRTFIKYCSKLIESMKLSGLEI